MSQQLICDGCGERIDVSQPYYSGNFQLVQDVEGASTVVAPAAQFDYHPEHAPLPPRLSSLQPEAIGADASDTQVHVFGLGFDDTSKIVLDGQELATAFVSSGELYCTISGSHGVGSSELLARRGNSDSNALTFTIVGAS